MEIKIVISESRADAPGSGAHATGGTRGTGESLAASPIVAPLEVLQAAAALGAINAGPAPSVAMLSPTAGPPPFIGASAAETGGMVGAAGAPAAESAGAAPGTGTMVEATTAPEGGHPHAGQQS